MGNMLKKLYKYMIILGGLCMVFGVCIFLMGVISENRDSYPSSPSYTVYNLKLWVIFFANPYFWGGFWVSIANQQDQKSIFCKGTREVVCITVSI